MRRLRYAPAGDLEPAAGDDLAFSAVLNTEDVARDGDIVRSAGLDFGPYLRTGGPVLFAHDGEEPPVASVSSIFLRGANLLGTIRFPAPGVYDLADTIRGLVRAGMLRGTSIGWASLESRPLSNGRGREHVRGELYETSIVSVPANPETLIDVANARGVDLAPLRARAERAADSRSSPQKEQFEVLARSLSPRVYPARSPSRPAASVPAAPASPAFRSLGEFLQTVARSTARGEDDARLVRAPLGLGEVDPTGGGFLIPTNFAERLVASIYDDADIAPLAETIPIPGFNSATIPGAGEKSRADGSRYGGASAAWLVEGDSVAYELPRLRAITFATSKLFSAAAVSNELLGDASMLEAFLVRATKSEFAYKLDAAIVKGGGAGMPLGILRSGAAITAPREAGQAAATITAGNVDAMFASLPAPCRKRAVWLVGEGVDAQLGKLALTVGTGGSAAPAISYFPTGPGGAPVPYLKGRPVLAVENCAALGSLGDIILADLSQYLIVDAGLAVSFSEHALFTSDQSVFRFSWRLDGKPAWATPINSADGVTRSPFVALAPR